MPISPLAPVTDYPSMLNRIFWFTSAAALAGAWMLRTHVPAVEAWLGRLDAAVAWQGGKPLPFSAGYLLPALAVGIATRVFRLHARISDCLGIRECFDVEAIIGEMAAQLEIDLDGVPPAELRQARHQVMRKAFYPYVSGSQPAVDSLLVQQALDAWSWFWIGLEATAVFMLAGFALVAGSAFAIGGQTLCGATAFATLGLPALRGQCARYAAAQVRAIVADPARAAAVRAALGELTGELVSPRLAA
jgi:hypothetical protein